MVVGFELTWPCREQAPTLRDQFGDHALVQLILAELTHKASQFPWFAAVEVRKFAEQTHYFLFGELVVNFEYFKHLRTSFRQIY